MVKGKPFYDNQLHFIDTMISIVVLFSRKIVILGYSLFDDLQRKSLGETEEEIG